VNIVELEWMKKSTTKQADLLIGILLTIREQDDRRRNKKAERL
jgi:hypothetical protein